MKKLFILLCLIFIVLFSSFIQNNKIEVTKKTIDPDSTEIVDLFIFAGESNAVGPRFFKFPADPTYDLYRGLIPNVFTWNRHTKNFEQLNTPLNSSISSIDTTVSDYFASEISFMYEAQRNLHKQVYMLKYAYGSTTVAYRTNQQTLCQPTTPIHTLDWNSNSNELTTDLINYIKDIQEYFAASQKVVRIRGLFFWIGINDAANCLVTSTQSDRFRINLEDMVRRIRDSVGEADMPVHISKINKSVSPRSGLDIVKKRMAEFVFNDRKTEMFSTDIFTTWDGAHFRPHEHLEIGKNILAPLLFNNCNKFGWGVTLGGSTDKAQYGGYDIAVDKNGDKYVTGFFSGTAKFGNATLISNGKDGFLAKLDPQGNVVWAQKFGGPYADSGKSLSISPAGDIYITGTFSGFSCSFGLVNIVGRGNSDVFVAKYSSDGTLMWVRKAGGTDEDISNSIDASSGNIWITGKFKQSAVFGPHTITSTDSEDVFLAKYDSDGNVLWVNKSGGSGDQEGTDVSLDAMGNGYIAGSFENTLDPLVSKGNRDIFILKYNSSGIFQWGRGVGGIGNDLGEGISVDKQNNVHVTGSFENQITSESGSIESAGMEDLFYIKLNDRGAETFIMAYPGAAHDRGKDIAVDASGNTYITGWFNNKYPLNSSELFVLKYDKSGNLIWKNLSGKLGKTLSRGIALDLDSNPCITGQFNNTLSLDTISLTARNSVDDIFVTKFSCTMQNTPLHESMAQAETVISHELKIENIDLKIIPNPTQSALSVLISEGYDVREILITTITGRVVFRKSYNESFPTKNLTIDLVGKEKGPYLFKMNTEQGVIYRRFILN